MNQWINLNALWRILLFGLLFGAGLPTVFALGLRAVGGRTTRAVTAAGLCFALVAAAVAWGIYLIVAGS